MKKRSVVFLSTILLCFSVLFAFPTSASPGSFYEMTLTVSAGATRVPAGTPIVTKISVLKAAIPTGVDIDWDSVYVIHRDVPVPYQIDDLDGVSGVSDGDELVFQTAEDIASVASDTYTVWFATEDEDFPGPTYPVKAWTDYVANYSATDVAAAGNRTDVATWGAKPAYFLKNDLITISIPLQSDWRQGSVFDAIINATGFDVQHQKSYAQKPSDMEWSWRWSGFMYESDPGWVNTPTNFTLVKQIIQGPVRSMLVINSTAPYKDGGLKPGVHELKTVTIYKDMPAIYSDIQLTGANATEDYNFAYAVKFLDWCEANLYDTVYAPGVGYKTRYNYTLGAGVPGVLWNPEIGETNMTAWWYQMYNATSKQGYGVCFSPEDLQKIDWSAGELDIWYEDIDAPPAMARRLLVLYDPSVTTSSTDLMVDMYDMWSAEPTVAVTTAEETSLFPGWEKWMYQIVDAMNDTLTTLESTISDLESTISELESTIDDMESTIDALNSTLATTKSDLESKVSTATTYGTVGIIVGIIGIIVGAVALIRKPKA